MTTSSGPHQGQPLLHQGKPLNKAQAAMILVHGRGATAQSILELASVLPHPEMTYVAPQASGNTWYPQSFMAPIPQNEPWLTSALQIVADTVATVEAAGVPVEQIIIGGFSQGACLASEFAARNARRYGGLLLFSGGLIGPPGTPRNYDGSLESTPVFMGCSDIDFHIPLERVEETAVILTNLGATVNKKIYPNMGHTIIQNEIDEAQKIVNALLTTN